MGSTSVLTFVIVGHEDHPIYEADLSNKSPEGTVCFGGWAGCSVLLLPPGAVERCLQGMQAVGGGKVPPPHIRSRRAPPHAPARCHTLLAAP